MQFGGLGLVGAIFVNAGINTGIYGMFLDPAAPFSIGPENEY